MGELGESLTTVVLRRAFSALHSDRKVEKVVDAGSEWRRVRRRSEDWAVSEEVPELSEESGIPNRIRRGRG